MNARIKELRKKLGLTMDKFGAKVGIKKSAVSLIESGKNGVTEQMVKIIVSEFNVSEEWLRTGKGDMFVELGEFSLDEFCKKREMSELELGILKSFFNIPEPIRRKALEYFVKGFQELDLDLQVLKDKKASLERIYKASGVNEKEDTSEDASKETKTKKEA